ncbi:MAG: hypothetical protein ACYDHH_17570 [Solirubrobacteraceae bacterium]
MTQRTLRLDTVQSRSPATLTVRHLQGVRMLVRLRFAARRIERFSRGARRSAAGWAGARVLAVVVLAVVAFPCAAMADFTINEGRPFSGKVVDVGGCVLSSATIYWGDGTPTSPGMSDGGTGVLGSHTYIDERTANAYVDYACSNLVGPQAAFFQVTVQDAPLTSVGRDISGTAGVGFTSAPRSPTWAAAVRPPSRWPK